MNVRPIKTRIFHERENLFSFITEHIRSLPENSILVVTSKIVALSEGRTAPLKDKERIIARESIWRRKAGPVWLTIAHGLFLSNAGIDESNANGKIILLPKDCMASARTLRRKLLKHYKRTHLGVLITDSRIYPLRAGVVGVALGHAGFEGLRAYAGTPDLFGRTIVASRTNMADCLASAAVIVMGEGAESQPLALITSAPVRFADRIPKRELMIDPREDRYFPLLPKNVRRR